MHFLRDMLGHCTKDQQPMVSGAIRQIFAAEHGADAGARLGEVAVALEQTVPKVARLLEEAEDDLLAYLAFPTEHWCKLPSTNPLERVNREIGRRSDVVGICPNDAALIRLAGSLLIERPMRRHHGGVMKAQSVIIGYDPGGNDCHGIARVLAKGDRATSVETMTLATTEDVIRLLEQLRSLDALGVDTLSCWFTGRSGWRPADRWLRKRCPAVLNSVVSPNALGSRA